MCCRNYLARYGFRRQLNTQPTDTPVRRFKCSLTTALTWLGARVVRYSFPVRLFHSLLHAGLSRRYPDKVSAPQQQPKTFVTLVTGHRGPFMLTPTPNRWVES